MVALHHTLCQGCCGWGSSSSTCLYSSLSDQALGKHFVCNTAGWPRHSSAKRDSREGQQCKLCEWRWKVKTSSVMSREFWTNLFHLSIKWLKDASLSPYTLSAGRTCKVKCVSAFCKGLLEPRDPSLSKGQKNCIAFSYCVNMYKIYQMLFTYIYTWL